MPFLAHKNKNRDEYLEEHLNKTAEYAKRLLEIEIPSKKIVLDAIKMHDIGKVNKGFQKKIKGDKDCVLYYSDHSLPSSAYFIQKYSKKNTPKDLIVSLAYLIAKHHSGLGVLDVLGFLEDFISSEEDFYKITKILEENLDNFPDLDLSAIEDFKNDDEKGNCFSRDIKPFIFLKLFYSLMISADYYATFDFYQNREVDNFGRIKDKEILFKKFKEKYSKIINTKNKSKLNEIRTDLSAKALNNFLESDKNIFFLNAPTGAGKTLMSLNLSSHTSIKKLFYVFPFNTIAEQTAKVFGEYFDKEDYRVINSTTGIDEEEKKLKEDILLNIDMMHFPVIITSSVKMFNILFGNKKRDNFNFWQLQNSLIIFDEVQSVPLRLIKPFIEYLKELTEILNCKVILMSATLPKSIFEMYINKNDVGILLEEDTLYIDVFKNRVKINKLGEIDSLENLADAILKKLNNENKILIEFFKKKRAINFFKYIKELKEYQKYNIRLITGDTDKLAKEKIINECKKDNKTVLVSTQVIEAGVDIDMDIGFKQISTFESEEQFLGRINRNCKKDARAYFFDLNQDSIKEILKDDLRAKSYLTISKENIFKILKSKQIDKYYKKLKNQTIKYKTDENTDFIYFGRGYLDFQDISKRMKLIKENTFTLFVPFILQLSEEDRNYLIKYKKFIKEECIDGKEILDYYTNVLHNKNLTFSDKNKELYFLREILNIFTFNVYKNYLTDLKKEGYLLKDKIGDMFVVSYLYADKVFDLENRILNKDLENYELFL